MTDPASTPSAAAGMAMQQAISAEQQARRAITDANTEARAAVERARAQARTILNQVPDRIARLRTRGARAVQQALAVIQAEEAATSSKLGDTAFPPQILERTVAQLVRRMTGGEL